MIKFAAALHHFLMQHGIDPDKVNVILRAKDERTLFSLQVAVTVEGVSNLEPTDPASMLSEIGAVQVHGLLISLKSLDRSL